MDMSLIMDMSHSFQGPGAFANGSIDIRDALMKSHFVEDEFTTDFNCLKLIKIIVVGRM